MYAIEKWPEKLEEIRVVSRMHRGGMFHTEDSQRDQMLPGVEEDEGCKGLI